MKTTTMSHTLYSMAYLPRQHRIPLIQIIIGQSYVILSASPDLSVQLFFKWIKQHLRIKAFYGTTENAVKIQIWIAITVFVMVAIVKKHLKLDLSLYTILQIMTVTLFEKTPISEALSDIQSKALQFLGKAGGLPRCSLAFAQDANQERVKS